MKKLLGIIIINFLTSAIGISAQELIRANQFVIMDIYEKPLENVEIFFCHGDSTLSYLISTDDGIFHTSYLDDADEPLLLNLKLIPQKYDIRKNKHDTIVIYLHNISLVEDFRKENLILRLIDHRILTKEKYLNYCSEFKLMPMRQVIKASSIKGE